MADKVAEPVEFDKMNSGLDPALETTLGNMLEFSKNVSELTQNLLSLFTVMKYYLKAIKDPLALVLIPALDALIATLEELKNVGFGSLSVWPWEVGKIESGVDTSKVEEALTMLMAAIEDVDPKQLTYNVTNDDFDYNPLDLEGTARISSHSKISVLTAMEGIQSFFNPGKWTGPFDEAVNSVIQKINESFKIRTLTPSQFISEVNNSFDDVNDPNRPIGSGQYGAFVCFFALPTHHALRDMIQAFMDFFGNVAKDTADLVDDRIELLELGDPLIAEGLEAEQNREDIFGNFAKCTIKRELGNFSGTVIGNEDNDYLPEVDVYKQTARSRGLKAFLPMFAPGTLIQQGGNFNDFTAEVVQHDPIIIIKGKVIKNTVRIKSKRGTLKLNTAEGDQPNTSPVISLNPKDLFDGEKHIISQETGAETAAGVLSFATMGLLRYGLGMDGSVNFKKYPMFSPPSATVPKLTPSTEFVATIKSDDDELTYVLPAPKSIQGGIIKLHIKYWHTDISLLNNFQFRSEMISFYESLSKGQPIMHDYIVAGNSETFQGDAPPIPKTYDDDYWTRFAYKRLLWSTLPGLGFQPCIKNITIKGKDLEKGDLESQLFVRDTDHPDKFASMNSVSIKIGRMVRTGEIVDYLIDANEYFPSIDFSISVPDDDSRKSRKSKDRQEFYEMGGNFLKTFIVEGGANTLPNWKFTRIQDFWPLYGDLIDNIIDRIEFAKSMATGALDSITKAIKYLEDIIEDFEKLNKQIQDILVFFANGLSKSGLYSATISGVGGISEFKERLSSAKIMHDPVPIQEFELVPVTTEHKVRNFSTGQDEYIKTTTIKPKDTTLTQEEFDAQNPNKEKVPLSFSDLDSLKYSGGFVFFAKSPLELESLKQFEKLSGDLGSTMRGEYKEKEITDEINSYLEYVRPYVKEIQVKNRDSNAYQDAEGSDNIIRDAAIKIIFTNDADQLTDEQKRKIRDNKRQDFEFGVGLHVGNIVPNANVILSTDDFVNAVPLNGAVEAVGTSGSEFLIRTSSPMESFTNHKLKVISVARSDSLTLKKEFISDQGFITELTTSNLGIS